MLSNKLFTTWREGRKNAVERVKRQQEQKYGYGYDSWYKLTDKANIEFFGKLKNNTKNVCVEGRRVVFCARKREIPSKGRFEMIEVNKLNITIVGELQRK